MKLNNSLTDATVLEELGRRLACARIAASLTQADLADRASVGKRTVERIEAGGSVTTGQSDTGSASPGPS